MTEERRIDQDWPIIYAHISRGTGAVGGFKHFRYTGIDGTARIIIPDDENDVAGMASMLYAVLESAGGTAGGAANIAPAGTVTLYNDGVDTLTMDCTPGGELHVHRGAGAATFSVDIWVTWV